MSDTESLSVSPRIDYQEVQASAEFQQLRRQRRSFVLPLTAGALLWFFAYVIMGTYFSDVMAIPVIGHINLGLILGLAQFVTTFAITMGYVRYANRVLDPPAGALRSELESRAGGAA